MYHPARPCGVVDMSFHTTGRSGVDLKEAIVKRMTVPLAAYTVFLAISLQAQAPQSAPKPGPELKKLDYNIGTWKAEGETKPFGTMPGGKSAGTQKCEWYSGGFFVMCHSESTGPMGPGKSVSFMGYDPNEKVYTYHEFTSTGEAIDAKGTVSGDTWNWTAESTMGDAKISVHVTVKEVSKTKSTFKLEISQNGGEFSVVQESTSHKVTTAAPAKKS
jgi:Protein of unknown function (DUF1579)